MTIAYLTDDDRWAAGQARDPKAVGHFLTGVLTTGVYCLPTCSGRPLRKNVRYFDTAAAARAAGLRACKRCRPDEARETLRFTVVDTDLGRTLIAVSDVGLRAVLIGDDDAALAADLKRRWPQALISEDAAGLAATARAVARRIADPVAPLDLSIDDGGTELQGAVWAELRRIPAGRRVSYAELAARIGRPTAVRAVAQACGANPLAVVTPCHRVVRSDGGLSGYRWGVERKRRLLDLEAAA